MTNQVREHFYSQKALCKQKYRKSYRNRHIKTIHSIQWDAKKRFKKK